MSILPAGSVASPGSRSRTATIGGTIPLGVAGVLLPVLRVFGTAPIEAIGLHEQDGDGRLTQPGGCHRIATARLLLGGEVMGFPGRIERTVALARLPGTSIRQPQKRPPASAH